MTKKRKPKARPFVKPDCVIWTNRGWQSCFIGFCPSERAWYAMLKKLGMAPEYYPNRADSDTAATTNVFISNKTKSRCLVVTIRDDAEKKWRKDPSCVAALFVHESLHVWQEVQKNMKQAPGVGDEIEAYSVQAIFQQLFDAYLDTRILKRSK